jgi:hypothetical protein
MQQQNSTAKIVPFPVEKSGDRPFDVRLLELLEQVDSIHPDDIGVFVFGPVNSPHGIVFVEGSQICWAMDYRCQGKLRAVLKGSFEILDVPSDLDVILKGLKTSQDIMQAYRQGNTGLRVLFLEHCADAITSLLDDGLEPVWQSRDQRFGARFPFTTAEILSAIYNKPTQHISWKASQLLRNVIKHDGSGVALRLNGTRWDLVAAVDPVGAGVKQIIQLVRWCTQAMNSANGVCSKASVIFAETCSGGVSVAWRRDSLLFGGVATTSRLATLVVADQVRYNIE